MKSLKYSSPWDSEGTPGAGMMLRFPNMPRADSVPASISAWLGGMEAPAWRETMGFRLVRPSDRLLPATTEGRMPRQFTATILLEEPGEPEVEAIAATMAMRFPTIGRIGALPATGESDGAVTIDGARVTLRLSDRVPEEGFLPPLKLIRPWDPVRAIRRHTAALEVACGGELPGLEGAEAYAAAVHFVATAACQVAPATAILWREGWAVSDPEAFARDAESILSGCMPLSSWVGFAAIVPRGHAPEEATGMVTYGLRPFIGREIELAPRPGGPREACRCVSRVARMALDRGIALEDGQHLADPGGAFAVTVRERNYWLRPDHSAYVLVADDSFVDAETLKPRNRVA